MAKFTRWGLFGLMAFLSVGVALVSYRYLVPGGAFADPGILGNRFTKLGVLTTHAGFAATALLIGSFQFVPAIRRRWPSIHRRIGTVYVACCMAGGVAGLLLASGTTYGPIAGAGFGLLALSWLGVTGNAWRLARGRDFVRHERWMIRSFALTLAAVTLRLYLPIGAMMGLSFAPAYVAIAWLCWIPNLIVAELWLALRASRRSAPVAA